MSGFRRQKPTIADEVESTGVDQGTRSPFLQASCCGSARPPLGVSGSGRGTERMWVAQSPVTRKQDRCDGDVAVSAEKYQPGEGVCLTRCRPGLIFEVSDCLDAGDFDSATALPAGNNVVKQKHVALKLRKAGFNPRVGVWRRLLLLFTDQPAQLVSLLLIARRAVQNSRLSGPGFVAKQSFVHS
jgi:hypothetical protein